MADFGDLIVAPFFRTNLANVVEAGAVSIRITDGSGIPDIATGKHLYATLVDGNRAETVQVVGGWGYVSGGTVLTLGAPTVTGFDRTARLELWFTAEAFQEMQTFITGIVGSNYPGVDEQSITVGGSTIAVNDLGVGSEHLQDNAVIAGKIFTSAVTNATIANEAVTKLKLGLKAVSTDRIEDFAVGNDQVANTSLGLDKLAYIGPGVVLGNLTDESFAVSPVPVQQGYLGNDMGEDAGGTEQWLTNQRAVYHFVKDQIAEATADLRAELLSDREFVEATVSRSASTSGAVDLNPYDVSSFTDGGLIPANIRAVHLAWSCSYNRDNDNEGYGLVHATYPGMGLAQVGEISYRSDFDSASVYGTCVVPINAGQTTFEIQASTSGTNGGLASISIRGFEQRVDPS